MKTVYRLRSRMLAGIAAVAMTTLSMMPVLAGRASALQISSRSLTLTTATASATGVDYTIGYTLPDTTNVGSMEFIFCTTPLGACTAPAGLSVETAITIGNQTTNTGFSLGSGGDVPDDTGTASAYLGSHTNVPRIRITRTAAAGSTSAASIRFDDLTNPSGNTQTPAGNNTFFVRFATFSDTGYATGVHDGTIAAAIVPLLTINARVQEILHFCVGSLIDAGTYTGTDDCATVAGTTSTVDLGPVDSTGITTSPDDDGNDRDGVLMMRTNAAAGTISYRSVINGSGTSGALKKSTDTCAVAAVSTSDGCFNYATTTGGDGTLGTGIEGFGMWLSNYDAASASATTNLAASAPYSTSADYVWEGDPTAVTQIASQTNGVDDEAFRIRFGARAVLTTQTGNYSTRADFIAVATY